MEIVAQANSLKALIKITEPDCVWGETNMMWAVKDANGLSEIALNQAFLYEPEEGVPKWVLLDRANRRRGGEYYHTVVKLCEKIQYNNTGFDNYAMLKAANKDLGKVYEIGWSALMNSGVGLNQDAKRIYFLERLNGQWLFIGEGPVERSGKLGWCKSYRHNVENSNVVWSGDPNNPVQIEFTFKKGKYMWCSSDDGPDCFDPPNLVYYRDGILSMSTGSKTQWVDLPYTLTEQGDSLKKILLRLIVHSMNLDLHYKFDIVAHSWYGKLVQLNPDFNFANNNMDSGLVLKLPEKAQVDYLHTKYNKKITLDGAIWDKWWDENKHSFIRYQEK